MTATENDSMYMSEAKRVALTSRDPHQVGAVLLTSISQVFKAHNELPPDVTDYTYRRKYPERMMFVSCAEEQVVLAGLRGRLDMSKDVLYVTELPCPFCARIISLARVGRVVYLPSQTSLTRAEKDASIAIMHESGVVLEVADDVGPQ